MLKRLLSASLLLLLIAVQAFAADCELRCATMTAAPGHHDCGSRTQADASSARAKYCHGMSMAPEQTNRSVSASDQCHPSLCKFQFGAIAKQSGVDEFTSAPVVILAGQSTLNLTARNSAQFTIHRSGSRQETRAPLDLRPGSSLRI